jgi:hypothetical protein
LGLVLNSVLKVAVLAIILAQEIYVKPDVGNVGPIEAAAIPNPELEQSKHLILLKLVNCPALARFCVLPLPLKSVILVPLPP